MKIRPILTRGIATLIAGFALSPSANAQTSGTWNVNNAGNWSLNTNWLDSTIANGADATASFRFNITAARTVTLDTAARTIGNLSFEDATTASHDWTLASSAAGNVLTLDVTTGPATISVLNRVATINTILAGNDGIAVNHGGGAGGTLVLGAANTFTGNLSVAGSVVQLNNNSAAGNAANSITLSGGAGTPTSRLVVNAGVSIPNNIILEAVTGVAGRGVIERAGTGRGTINGTITINGAPSAGGHFVGGGAVGDELVLNGAITSVINPVTQRVGRVIYGGGGTGYTGLLATGAVIVGAPNGISTAAVVTLGGSGAATLDLNGFNQQLAGLSFGAGTENHTGTVNLGARTLTLTGDITTLSTSPGHIITASTGGALDFGAAPGTLNINEATSPDDLIIEGATIRGTGGITKTGFGTLALSGVSVPGALTVDSGTLATGRFTQPGQVTAGTLAFGAGFTNLRMKIGPGGDLITAGTVTVAGNTTIELSQFGGALPVGTHSLINYTGASPGIAAFTLATLPGHVTGSLVDTGTAIALNVTGNDKVIWTGANGAFWDTATPSWKLQSNGNATSYIESDDVTFADNPVSNTVEIFTNVAPSKVSFTNTTATTYTVTGVGGIIGATDLTKTGSGTVVLSTPNSYGGATTVSEGTLELDHDATGNQVLTGSSGVSLAAGTMLKLTRDDGGFTFSRNLSGTGTVEATAHSVVGSATAHSITLSGNNTGFTGALRLLSPQSGTYRILTPSAANLGGASIEVQSGAQVYTAANQVYNNSISIAGTGFADANGNIGALRLEGGSTWAGPVVVNGAARIGAHNSTGTVSGNISGGDLTVNATNYNNSYTLIFTGSNSYGETIIGGQNTQTAGVPSMRLNIGNGGTTGTLGAGNVTINGDGANGVLGFDRADGYTLASGQTITGAGTQLTRTFIDFDTLGAGFSDNGNAITLGTASVGGNLRVGQSRAGAIANFSGNLTAQNLYAGSAQRSTTNLNSGANVNVSTLHVARTGASGSVLNINPGSTTTVTGQFNIGEQAANNSGTVNQSGGDVSVGGHIRVGHWGTLTANYNLSGGTVTMTGTPTQFPYSTVSPQETNGGIYLGIDGTGNLTQSGGTVTTNFLLLDNRGDTGSGGNMPSGHDTYKLSGGSIVFTNALGLISRNATTSVLLNGGTIRAGAGISPNLDTNKIVVGGTTTIDTNGANTFTLYGPTAGTGTLTFTGGGTFQTLDGTGATLTQAGGGMPGGSLGTVSANIGAANILQANRIGLDAWTGAISGSGALVKQNTGALYLTGNGSAFTGTTTVSAGRLDLPASFGSSAVNVADGAALGGEPTLAAVSLGSATGGSVFVNGSTPGALTATNLTLNGTTTVDFSVAPTAGGPITVLNYGTLTGTPTFALANTGNYRSASFNTATPGTVTLNVTTKNLTWTGSTSGAWDQNTTANWSDGVTGENFFAGDNVAFTDGPSAVAVSVASGVSPFKTTVNSDANNYVLTSTGSGIAGAGSLEKSGLSTLTLVGPNTYSGQTVLNGGTLSISAANSLGNAAPTNALVFNGGKLTATAAMDLGATRPISVLAGGGTISGAGSTAYAVTVPNRLSGSGTLNFTSGSTTAPTFVLSGENSGFSGDVNVDSVGATAGATTLRLASDTALVSSTVTLSPALTSTSGSATGVDLANVTIGSDVALSMTGTLVGTSSFRSQLTTSGGINTWNGPIVLNGDNIIQFSANHPLTLNGNTTAGVNGFTGIMFLRGGSTGVVNGTINLPNGTVSKTDASTWTINSTGNSWAATSVANGGSIKLGAHNALPITASLNIGQPSDASSSLLDLNGFNQEVPSISYTPGTGNSSRGITNTSTTLATLTVNNANDVSYGASTGVTGGLLIGNLQLVKNGEGSLTLAGANTFTGNVIVNGGTLVAGGSTVTGLGSATTAGRSVTVNNGSTLSFTTNNVFGNGVNNTNLPSVVLNGSTLSSTRYNVLGDLTLNGSTVTQDATDSGGYEGFQFRGDVSVTGNAASTIAAANGKANHLGSNTTFDVADVSGSSAADLLVSSPLRDQSGDFGSAAGGFTKTGTGTMELTGTNTYTGTTNVNAGTLLVSGAIAGNVTVNSGGTLGGIGTVGPVNVLGGIVAPGAAAGTLSTGAFSLDSTAAVKFELAQAGVIGSGINDLISVIGNLTLDGTLLVDSLPGFNTGTYRLFNYTGALNDAGLSIDSTFLAAYPGSVIDTATAGQVNLVVVPEPAALMSLLGGVGGLLGFRRFRRQASV